MPPSEPKPGVTPTRRKSAAPKAPPAPEPATGSRTRAGKPVGAKTAGARTAGAKTAGGKTNGSDAAASPGPRLPEPVGPETLVETFRRWRAIEPEPRGELEYVNPYTLLVAVALSAQATDVGVNKATRALFQVADTPGKMLDLGEERLLDYVKSINFFRTKAKNVIALSRRLVEEFGGEVPASVEILETLPGVGRKTASVVVNMAFGIPRIAVDTHIFRVANRIPFVNTREPLDTQVALEGLVPDEFRLHAHHWLILHGRYTCKARLPECWRCPIRDLCRYEPKTPDPAA